MTTRTILEMTPEQTAAWFAGDPTPWTRYLVPDLRDKLDETKLAIRRGFEKAQTMGLNPDTPAGLRAIAKCLAEVPNAPLATQELFARCNASLAGEPFSYDGLRTKLNELAELGFSDA